MRLTLALIATVLASGCVGLAIPKEDSNSYPIPGVTLSSRSWTSGPAGHTQTYTKEEVLKEWGTPDETSFSEGMEHWSYNSEIRWIGVIVFLLIPLPIMVPTGHHTTTLDFVGEDLTMVHSRHGTFSRFLFLCGVFPGHAGSFGCI